MRKYHAFSAKMSFVTSKPSVRRYLMKNTAVDIELYTVKIVKGSRGIDEAAVGIAADDFVARIPGVASRNSTGEGIKYSL